MSVSPRLSQAVILRDPASTMIHYECCDRRRLMTVAVTVLPTLFSKTVVGVNCVEGLRPNSVPARVGAEGRSGFRL